MDETTDKLGQPVKAGDRVAVAFRSGNSAEIRTGTVIGFGSVKSSWGPDGREPTLMVEWDKLEGHYQTKPSGIWISNKRFVKIA